MKKRNKHFLYGSIFGLLAPFIGLFAGLQIAPFLGEILMFPFVIISTVVGQPFGEFSTFMMVLSTSLSMILWGSIFVIVTKVISNFKK